MGHELHSPMEFPLGHLFGLVLVLSAGAVYGRLWARNRDSFRRTIPPWRAGAFYCGLLFLGIAAGSPLAHLDHELLTLHMVQHLLLSTVAAPLLLLGEPFLVFARGRRQRSDLPLPVRAVSKENDGQVARWFSHPVFCWLAGVGAVLAWHVPQIFALAMQSPQVHAIEHISFFATGLLFWFPVLRPWPVTSIWPRWSIPLYLLLATLPCDALSAFLAFCDRVVYSAYQNGSRHFEISALQDQECAGALMWVWVTIVYLVPAFFITLQILAPPVPEPGVERRAT